MTDDHPGNHAVAAHDWKPAPWLNAERTDGSVAQYEACECGANRSKPPTSDQPLHEQIPFRVIRRFTGELGVAFSTYETDGLRFFRVWIDDATPNQNIVALIETEFTVEEPPSSELEQRQTDWTNGHDLGVEEGLRVAFELVIAQQDATARELQRQIDALEPGKSKVGFEQRLALRARGEGLREAYELIGKELRRRRFLRRAPGSSKGEALTKI